MDNFEEYFDHLEKIITHLIEMNKSEESSNRTSTANKAKNTVYMTNINNMNPTMEKSYSNSNLIKNAATPLRENKTDKNNTEIKKSIKKILHNDQPNDWLNFLNIGNIMFLSSLNLEDLDLESESKFELLRDAMVEKVVFIN